MNQLPTTKGPFIATQLNSTQLNSTSSWVELRRYKRALSPALAKCDKKQYVEIHWIALFTDEYRPIIMSRDRRQWQWFFRKAPCTDLLLCFIWRTCSSRGVDRHTSTWLTDWLIDWLIDWQFLQIIEQCHCFCEDHVMTWKLKKAKRNTSDICYAIAIRYEIFDVHSETVHKGPFIATQLNSTRRRVELSWVASL